MFLLSFKKKQMKTFRSAPKHPGRAPGATSALFAERVAGPPSAFSPGQCGCVATRQMGICSPGSRPGQRLLCEPGWHPPLSLSSLGRFECPQPSCLPQGWPHGPGPVRGRGGEGMVSPGLLVKPGVTSVLPETRASPWHPHMVVCVPACLPHGPGYGGRDWSEGVLGACVRCPHK